MKLPKVMALPGGCDRAAVIVVQALLAGAVEGMSGPGLPPGRGVRRQRCASESDTRHSDHADVWRKPGDRLVDGLEDHYLVPSANRTGAM